MPLRSTISQAFRDGTWDAFSWRHVNEDDYYKQTGRILPTGRYAGDAVDQHAPAWCGCCYIVAVAQMVEDRARIAMALTRGRSSRHWHLCVQTLLDHFRERSVGNSWNACHGGFPVHVLECMQRGTCPLSWKAGVERRYGFARLLWKSVKTDLRVGVETPQRIPNAEVKTAILLRGPVVLEVSGERLKSLDERGIVTDLSPAPANHAVCVVGWTEYGGVEMWIVRNSWGSVRVPHAIPADLGCVTQGSNECDVDWDPWSGDPRDPGFLLLPCSFPPLHASSPSPWIEAAVREPR